MMANNSSMWSTDLSASSPLNGRPDCADMSMDTADDPLILPELESFDVSGLEKDKQGVDWIEWYQETFALELGMIEGAEKQKKQRGSKEGSDVQRLKRRLKAVDALDELASKLECSSPIPSKMWEDNAPWCRDCKNPFGIFNFRRPHHCRFCGLCFCDTCAPGEVRKCRACILKTVRCEAIKKVRALEREAAGSKGVIGKEQVNIVAIAYRSALGFFSNERGDTEEAVSAAKHLLLEGFQSFLDLDEVKSSRSKTSS